MRIYFNIKQEPSVQTITNKLLVGYDRQEVEQIFLQSLRDTCVAPVRVNSSDQRVGFRGAVHEMKYKQ